ncbi:MAG: glycosyltransferase [Candidatus Krumholzibacteriota bacterium]|nr:glycosyltransferase [Candidatus Krumholzibacteriota bacterium]
MKRKVLHIIYSLYRGGAERLLETIYDASDGDRFEHAVCSLAGGGDLARSLREKGAPVYLLGKSPGFDPFLLPRLMALIRRLQPDLLQLHSISSIFYGTLAARLGRSRAPIIQMEHGPWRPSSMPALHRLLYPWLAARAGKIVTVSSHAQHSFTTRFPRLASKYVTIPNGINTGAFSRLPPPADCRRLFGLPTGCPLAGTVGRLVPEKNHALLLRAFRRVTADLPGARLALLGSGPLQDDLLCAAAAHGLSDAVYILPLTSRVAEFLGALDLFVLSSDSEGIPLTLLEALACGLPTVCTAVGGIPEVIEQGINGHLVPAGAEGELARRMVEVLRDPPAASSLGERGRKTVEIKFNASRLISETEALYRGLLA